MKLVDISSSCYAHLMVNTIYIYIDSEFKEMLYVDDIETEENPIPFIVREIELSLRPSLYECIQLID